MPLHLALKRPPMPTHKRTYIDDMAQWLREPQVPRQPELPGVSRVVRTPGQTGILGETDEERPTMPAPPPDPF
jgi:hypothetical protein